jgi:hypothetical protein
MVAKIHIYILSVCMYAKLWSKLAQVMMLVTCIQEVRGLSFGQDITVQTEI